MIPKNEIELRLKRFRALLDEYEPDWSVVVISKKISIYYLSGTLASGLLWINRNQSEPKLFVRSAVARASAESPLRQIHSYRSYRDILDTIDLDSDSVLLEKSTMTLSGFELFNKYFNFKEVKGVEQILARAIAVKTEYEVERLRRAGAIHQEVLENIAPTIIQAGISEAELGAEILKAQLNLGSHGVARFQMPDTDMFLGYISFSENGLIPTYFDGPDGTRGNCPAVPFFGSPERHLQEGDTIFIDTACGHDGYHTDKTCLYTLGKFDHPEAIAVHQRCVDIQNLTASLLKPGAIPAEIYNQVLSSLPADFRDGFMGCPEKQVNFLGHGTGLHVDEYPVIADKFYEPLQKNMIIAIEPKKGLPGVGMLGIENTFLITDNAAESLTGSGHDIINII